jgi:hypothetical protein
MALIADLAGAAEPISPELVLVAPPDLAAQARSRLGPSAPLQATPRPTPVPSRRERLSFAAFCAICALMPLAPLLLVAVLR